MTLTDDDAYVGPIQHHESQTVECWCHHCLWWSERARMIGAEEERARLRERPKTELKSFLFHLSDGERALIFDFTDWLLAAPEEEEI